MNILFLGGDTRYISMAQELSNTNLVSLVGFTSCTINSIVTNEDINSLDLNNYDIVILPMNGINDNMEIKSMDGQIRLDKNIFKFLKNNVLFFTGLKNKNIINLIPGNQIISFLDDENVTKQNNYLTCLGILDDINKLNYNSVCILGFGNIGKEIYKLLEHKNINIYVGLSPYDDTDLLTLNIAKSFSISNENEMINVFHNCDIIINTIPSNIVSENVLKSISCYFLDIASSPHGVNQDLVKKHNINYKLYLGIPSKFAPLEASKILLDSMKKVVD